MRYANILEFDVTNGTGVGVSLFVQGCPHHCKNCFNPETWSFNEGKEWNENSATYLLNLVSRKYISRISILGGEPLCKENLTDVKKVIESVHRSYPDVNIWVYTGYEYEELTQEQIDAIFYANVLIDGRFEEDKKSLALPFRGSSNQRIIDIQNTLNSNKIKLYKEV